MKIVEKRILHLKIRYATSITITHNTQCDTVIALKLHCILPTLLKLAFEEQIQHDEWKHVLTKQFTHLHPKNHNIFSPNKVNSQPVNGMFLSSQTLKSYSILL